MLEHIEGGGGIAPLQKDDFPEEAEAEKEAHQGNKEEAGQQMGQLDMEEGTRFPRTIQGRRLPQKALPVRSGPKGQGRTGFFRRRGLL